MPTAKFPTNPYVIDNFNRASGPGGGAPPAGWSAYGYADGTNLSCYIEITNSAARDTNGKGGFWNTVFDKNCEVYITHPTASNWPNNSNWNLLARMKDITTTTPDGYKVQFSRRNVINGFIVSIQRIDNAVNTVLGFAAEEKGGQPADGNKYGFACYGAKLSAYIYRPATGQWTMAQYATDSTYSSVSGNVGYTNNNASGFVFDDFSGGSAQLTYKTTVINDGADAYYRLGEPSGTSAYDDSTFGLNTGTYAGGPTLGQAGAIADGNTAASFDGVDDQVSFTGWSLSAGQSVTIEWWQYITTADAASNAGCAFTIGYADNPNRCQAHCPYVDNILYWDYGDTSAGGRVTADYTAYLDKWTLVQLTFDAATNTHAITLDGVQVSSSVNANKPTIALSGGYIGRFQASFRKGLMDEFAIYKRALTTTERLAHFNARNRTGAGYDWRVWFPAFPESVTLTDSISVVKTAPKNYQRALASYSAIVKADNPISYWRLGEPSGTVAVDEKGLHNGTYVFNPTLGAASLLTGDGNTAMSCQGGGSQAGMQLVNDTEYQIGTGTIEAWVKTTDMGTAKSIVIKQFAFGMFAWGGNLYGYDWNAGPLDSGKVISDGVRHHVAMTFQAGGNMQLYCDGVAVGAPRAFSINAQSAYLGFGFNSAAGQDLIGVIDEAAIYGSVLTPAQIQRHYQAGITGGDGVALTDSLSRSRAAKRLKAGYREIVLADGPKSYYRLGEPSGTVITDSSGNGNHATTVGSPVMGVAAGIVGTDKAIQFDGVDDYITIPNSQVIDPTLGITLEWWQYVATADVKTNVAIALNTGGSVCQSHAPWSDQYLYWDCGNASYTGRAYTYYGAYLNSWVHVCLTFDPATNKHAISLNGVEVASTVAVDTPAVNQVGGFISHPSSPHKATVDEVAIYNKALTPAQIVKHYQAGLSALGSDGVALADALARTRSAKRTISDPIALSDNRTRTMAKKRTAADVIVLTDNRTRTMAKKRTVADTITLADLVTRFKGKKQTIGDAIALADSFARTMAKKRTVADTKPLTDALTRIRSSKRTVADVLALTDARKKSMGKRISDALALVDARTRAFSRKRTLTDSTTLSDVASPNKITGSIPYTRTISDAVELSDIGTINWTASRLTNHRIAISDQIIPVETGPAVTQITIAATMPMTPAMARFQKDFRLVAVTATLTPSLGRLVKYLKTHAGSVTLTPVISLVGKHPRQVDATTTLTPVMSRQVFGSRLFAAPLTFTPVITDVVKRFRTLAATTVITPALVRAGQNFPRTLAAVTTLTPALSKTMNWARAQAASVTLTPVLSRKLSALRAVDGTITLTPVIVKKLSANRTLAVTTVITPTLTRAGQAFLRTVAATTTIIPAISDIVKRYRSVDATVTLTPAMSRFPLITRALAATVTFIPLFVKKLSANRTISAIPVISPVMTRLARNARQLDATATLIPGLSRIYKSSKQVAAGVFLAPFMRAVKPGDIFSPPNIAGLGMWLDASQLALADGADVTVWPDLSGNGNDMSNRVGTDNPPNFRTSAYQGLPTISFTAANGEFFWHNNVAIGTVGEVFVVTKYNGATFPEYNGVFGDAAALLILGELGTNRFYPSNLTSPTYYYNGVDSTATRKAPMNELAVCGLSFSPITLTPIIGVDRFTSGRYWDGDVCEIITYDHVLTSIERGKVNEYLRLKWVGGSKTPVQLDAFVIFAAGVSRGRGYARTIPTAPVLTPVMNRLLKLSKQADATTAFIPALARKLGLLKTQTATTVITPSLMKAISKPVAVGLNLLPALSRRLSAYRTFGASTTLTPTLTPRVAAGRLLAASTTILASMTNAANRPRSLSANVTLTPAISFLSGKGRVLNATVSLVATLKKVLGKSMAVNLNFIPKIQRKSTMTLAGQMTLNPALSLRSRFLRVFDMVITLSALLSKATGKRISLAAQVPLTANMLVGRVRRVTLNAVANFTALLAYLYEHARKPIEVLFGSRPNDAQLLAVRISEETDLHTASADQEITTLLSAGNGEIPELEGASTEVPGLRSVT